MPQNLIEISNSMIYTALLPVDESGFGPYRVSHCGVVIQVTSPVVHGIIISPWYYEYCSQ